MDKVKIRKTRLIGLSLQEPTSHTDGQSTIDCKDLWEKFVNGKYMDTIVGKVSEDIFGVYYKYEADSSKPFFYFVGCEAEQDVHIPHGLESLTIPEGIYLKINAKGQMPDCVVDAWKNIRSSDLPRSYQVDFEVYDKRSEDWNDAEVDLYLSIK